MVAPRVDFHTYRWAMMLPASIQVCPIEIPGRGRREGEHGITSIEKLADTLALSLPFQVGANPRSIHILHICKECGRAIPADVVCYCRISLTHCLAHVWEQLLHMRSHGSLKASLQHLCRLPSLRQLYHHHTCML